MGEFSQLQEISEFSWKFPDPRYSCSIRLNFAKRSPNMYSFLERCREYERAAWKRLFLIKNVEGFCLSSVRSSKTRTNNVYFKFLVKFEKRVRKNPFPFLWNFNFRKIPSLLSYMDFELEKILYLRFQDISTQEN